ncbi:MAG: GNAT family N-acetyltransferase [Tessaracoccus sp.]
MTKTPIFDMTDPDRLSAAYEQLLVPNFPLRELITKEEFLAGVASGGASVRVSGDADTPTALAMLQRLPGTPAVLLTYFATRADLRGKGVGSTLLAQILDDLAADGSVSVVLAEVEHPAHHEASQAYGDPTARLRFYGRLGGRILDVPYFQPPIAEGEDPVYAMLLLALNPPERFVKDGRLMPDAGVAAGLERIMGELDETRFPVSPLRDAFTDPQGIRLVEVSALDSVAVSRPLAP